MTATTAPTANRAAGDPVVSLIEAYRERGDRRAVEQILSMHVKILNHIVRKYTSSSDESYEEADSSSDGHEQAERQGAAPLHLPCGHEQTA